MKLKEFIKEFCDHNSTFRLFVRSINSEYLLDVVGGDESIFSTCHELTNGYSELQNYADRQVVHIFSTAVLSRYKEPINIMIDGMDDMPLVAYKERERIVLELRGMSTDGTMKTAN